MSQEIQQTTETKIIAEIERRLGPYQTKPKVTVVPDLYKKTGALGTTTYLDVPNGVPKIIEIDENLFIYNEPAAYRVLTHELLEWRFIERGEQYHHYMAEKYSQDILTTVDITPIQILLWNRPILRRALLGY